MVGVVNKDGLAFTLEFRVHVNDESGSWVEEVVEGLDLGDPRRDRRAKALLKRLAAKRSMSPVVWRLLTNREADNIDAVVELIDRYRARWEIEMFFHVLKNGCNVEALQLSQIDRVERALALYMVVAWRIAPPMHLGQTYPELDALLFFHADEIRGAFLLARKPRPKTPVALIRFIRLIASLGGFLGRKSDGEPGAKTLWIDMQRTMDAASTIPALREDDV